MRQDCAILLYALVKGCCLNAGKIDQQSILDNNENNFSGNIPHPALITLLCIKGGGGGGEDVTFSEAEEKCLRSTPLTLNRVIKTLTQGEEVKRARKRKRAAIEVPREATPTV